MNEQEQKIIQRLSDAKISVTEEQATQLNLYFSLLAEKNKVMNLTAITEFQDVLEKHFLDSFMLAQRCPELFSEGAKLIDVGTGAGFPGLPLKILCPQVHLVLLDTLRKRVDFLSEVITALSLTDAQAIHSRAEDGAHQPVLRESFDLATARAVSQLPILCEYCLPFVKVGGVFSAYKSQDIKEELQSAGKAIRLLGGEVQSVEEFCIPGTELKRSIVLIRKIAPTPAKYPRSAGKPERNPLI